MFTFLTSIRTVAPAGNHDAVTTGTVNTLTANIFVVSVTTYGVTTPVGVLSDSKSNSWILARTQLNGGARVEFYYCFNPIVDSAHTFSYIGANLYPTIDFACYWGAGTDPLDKVTGAGTGGTGTASPGTITPAKGNCLIITGINCYTGIAPTMADPTYTVTTSGPYISAVYAGFSGGMAYKIQTADLAAETPSWTHAGSVAASFVANFYTYNSEFFCFFDW